MDDIIHSSQEPIISTLVPSCPIPGEVHSGKLREVEFLEARRVSVNGAHHPGPGSLDDEISSFIHLAFCPILPKNCWLHSEKGKSCRSRFQRGGCGEGCDQDCAGLGLPPCIDDRPSFFPNGRVVPHPSLGIDRLSA